MRRFIKYLSLTVGAVALVAAAFAFLGWWLATMPGAFRADTTVILPKGSSTAVIGARLAEAGVVRSSDLFMATVIVEGARGYLKAGEYRFPAGLSLLGVVEQMRAGRTVVRRLTVPEGYSVAEIMALLTSTDGLAGDLPPPPPEGTLLPETYYFSYDDQRADLVRRMRRAMTETLADAWTKRQADLPYRYPEDAVVLASMVEKETGLASERPLIAGLFINRLRVGMKLQSDPTTIYGLTEGRNPLDHALTRADLDSDTRWNTYRIDGLPPTPIANPGRASLLAALHPEPSGNFYFVADGTGGHAFAATLEQHLRNVQAWRKLHSGDTP